MSRSVLHSINGFFLLGFLLIAKCQAKIHDILVIPLGIINAETVIICGIRIQTYLSFDPDEVLHCPYVSIARDQLQLIGMNITSLPTNSIQVELSSQLVPSPKLFTKPLNYHMSNITNSTDPPNTFYLSFSPGLTCRYSSYSTVPTCFYYLSSINFTQLEYHYDRLMNDTLTSLRRSRNYFTIIYIILALLILTTCVLALYLLCTNRLSSEHMIELDYIVDPQLAKEAALKLAPEPV